MEWRRRECGDRDIAFHRIVPNDAGVKDSNIVVF